MVQEWDKREETETTRAVLRMDVEGRRKKLKKRRLDTIESNMRAAGVCVLRT